ncbi:PREDICTED: tetraspanin-5-like [Tarenaya hassleriana]|uniref:tetraspanin-5-like n=1 Tax=Tarenaya hassleriana TaxID=28532 RepID=UPI00053C2957|nr:PREDICTED: tetraspanin-5-like [Tarenaya hassleriana]
MYRTSNTVIGILNSLTLLASIAIIAGALGMAKSNKTCEHFLQKPLLILGLAILIMSLAGLVGACCNVACALWVYLFVMILVIAALMGLTVFGFVVTSHGGGVGVAGRVYKEYRVEDYHPWLRNRVRVYQYWNTIRSCLLGSMACSKVALWTPLDYLHNDLTPIQSGCCKPPTSCVYNVATMVEQDSDCNRWNNDANVLCYDCDSCRAGVMETVRRDWRKLLVLNVVVIVVLIAVYSIGCCAFQNAKRPHQFGFPYGHYGRSKSQPGWDDYWRRWWTGGGRDRFY